MMSTIRLENRGKNLIPKDMLNIFVDEAKKNGNTVFFTDKNSIYIKSKYYYTGYYLATKIPVKPNTTYTLSYQRNLLSLVETSYIYETIHFVSQTNKTIAEIAAPSTNVIGKQLVTKTFITPENCFYIAIRLNRSTTIHYSEVEYSNFQLEEGSEATEYEPPRSDYIEFDGEMFGMNSIYDELHDDGTLIKRWQRESITITSGAGTVSKNGTGTCILINETDGLPYEGTVSGTSISTSAPDGTYTVIYQLATPEIIDLNYDGELILHPGENNLILPDFAVAAISGARKYLEG